MSAVSLRTPRARDASADQRAERLASTFPPLLVAAERVAATVAQGVHGRRRTGQGEAFWQYRPYQGDDPASRIDWRQSARGDHLFVRETEWEAAQSVWLWTDGSASMTYRSSRGLPEKRERAQVLLLACAALLLRGGERVALFEAGSRPASGRGVLARMAHHLAQGTGAAPPDLPLPRHARLVMIGDFLMPLEALDRVIKAQAAHGVGGYLLQVLDPAERELPFSGRVRFEGMEREGGMLARRVEALRGAYHARLAMHEDGLREIARSVGWRFGRHLTSAPPETALLALYGGLAGPSQR